MKRVAKQALRIFSRTKNLRARNCSLTKMNPLCYFRQSIIRLLLLNSVAASPIFKRVLYKIRVHLRTKQPIIYLITALLISLARVQEANLIEFRRIKKLNKLTPLNVTLRKIEVSQTLTQEMEWALAPQVIIHRLSKNLYFPPRAYLNRVLIIKDRSSSLLAHPLVIRKSIRFSA